MQEFSDLFVTHPIKNTASYSGHTNIQLKIFAQVIKILFGIHVIAQFTIRGSKMTSQRDSNDNQKSSDQGNDIFSDSKQLLLNFCDGQYIASQLQSSC